MIGRLRGEVLERNGAQVVVDVQGVGYLVTASLHAPLRIGEPCDLYVHTAVRDDAITLFGFLTREEKELFDLLIGVPGVGPVKAMNILQTPVATLIEMVARREPAQLAKLPGVGKKTAERLLVDLGDKITALGPASASGSVTAAAVAGAAARPKGGAASDVVSALVNLGFKEQVSVEAAEAAVKALGDKAGLEELLREALAWCRPKG
ncbi:MAG: Holliday junction branch migration protein RuvA [Myxococcota bacterium]